MQEGYYYGTEVFNIVHNITCNEKCIIQDMILQHTKQNQQFKYIKCNDCLLVQVQQYHVNCVFKNVTTSLSPHLSFSTSSRSPSCLMSTGWITCRWMRRRLRHCKTPKWSGQMSGSQKHERKTDDEKKKKKNQEHLV